MNNKQYFQRNIRLLYVLSFLNYLWFWLAIWVFYYLLFTNYAGVGMIETAMIISMVVFEVPSGVLADLLGKKKVLILAFLAVAISEFVMSGALNFWMLIISASIGSLGTTMISGTFEAITYDSLKEIGRERFYDKILAKQRSVGYIANALATVIGGYIYMHYSHRLPFFLVGLVSLGSVMVALFLKEPKTHSKLDQHIFSWKAYWKQFKDGFQHLFSSVKLKSIVILLLVAGVIPLFMYEMVEDLILVNYGATAREVSIEIVLGLIASAILVHLSRFITRKLGSLKSFVGITLLYGITLLILSSVNLYGAILLIVFLEGIISINKVIRSKILNDQISSRYRATSLSTFNMLLSIPYIFMAAWLGYLFDGYGARKVVFALGTTMIAGVVLAIINFYWRNGKSKNA